MPVGDDAIDPRSFAVDGKSRSATVSALVLSVPR